MRSIALLLTLATLLAGAAAFAQDTTDATLKRVQELEKANLILQEDLARTQLQLSFLTDKVNKSLDDLNGQLAASRQETATLQTDLDNEKKASAALSDTLNTDITARQALETQLAQTNAQLTQANTQLTAESAARQDLEKRLTAADTATATRVDALELTVNKNAQADADAVAAVQKSQDSLATTLRGEASAQAVATDKRINGLQDTAAAEDQRTTTISNDVATLRTATTASDANLQKSIDALQTSQTGTAAALDTLTKNTNDHLTVADAATAKLAAQQTDTATQLAALKADTATQLAAQKSDTDDKLAAQKTDTTTQLAGLRADLEAEVSGARDDSAKNLASTSADLKNQITVVGAANDKLAAQQTDDEKQFASLNKDFGDFRTATDARFTDTTARNTSEFDSIKSRLGTVEDKLSMGSAGFDLSLENRVNRDERNTRWLTIGALAAVGFAAAK